MRKSAFLVAVGCVAVFGSPVLAQSVNPLADMMGTAQTLMQQAQPAPAKPTASVPAASAQPVPGAVSAQGTMKYASSEFWLEDGKKTTCLAYDVMDNGVTNALEELIGKAVVAVGKKVKSGNETCIDIGMDNIPKLANSASASPPVSKVEQPTPKITADSGSAGTPNARPDATDARSSLPKPIEQIASGQQTASDSGDDLLLVNLHPTDNKNKTNYMSDKEFSSFSARNVCIAENKQGNDDSFRKAKLHFFLRGNAQHDACCNQDGKSICMMGMSETPYALLRRKSLQNPDDEISSKIASEVNSTTQRHAIVAYTIPAGEIASATNYQAQVLGEIKNKTKAGVGFIVSPLWGMRDNGKICQLSDVTSRVKFQDSPFKLLREQYFGATGKPDRAGNSELPVVTVGSLDDAAEKMTDERCNIFAGDQDQIAALKEKLDARKFKSMITPIWGKEDKSGVSGIAIEVSEVNPAARGRCVVKLTMTNKTSINYDRFVLKLRSLATDGDEFKIKFGDATTPDENAYEPEYGAKLAAGESVKYFSSGTGFGDGFAAPCDRIAALKLRFAVGRAGGGQDVSLKQTPSLFLLGKGKLPIIIRDLE